MFVIIFVCNFIMSLPVLFKSGNFPPNAQRCAKIIFFAQNSPKQKIMMSLTDAGGRFPNQTHPILSFYHVFTEKHHRVGIECPPPPTGSAHPNRKYWIRQSNYLMTTCAHPFIIFFILHYGLFVYYVGFIVYYVFSALFMYNVIRRHDVYIFVFI